MEINNNHLHMQCNFVSNMYLYVNKNICTTEYFMEIAKISFLTPMITLRKHLILAGSELWYQRIVVQLGGR
jgi:hypothetical protein